MPFGEEFNQAIIDTIGAMVIVTDPKGVVQLFNKAASMAATLDKNASNGEPSLTAIFASRSVTAYAGILSALLRGHGYVPLNRKYPSDRTKYMLKQSGCQTIIVDAASAGQLNELLADIDEIFLILIPEP